MQSLFDGVIPYSHCQPYLRVTQPSETKEELELKMVDDAAKRKREVDELGGIGERARVRVLEDMNPGESSHPDLACRPRSGSETVQAVPAFTFRADRGRGRPCAVDFPLHDSLLYQRRRRQVRQPSLQDLLRRAPSARFDPDRDRRRAEPARMRVPRDEGSS